jgi:hypothetical protein
MAQTKTKPKTKPKSSSKPKPKSSSKTKPKTSSKSKPKSKSAAKSRRSSGAKAGSSSSASKAAGSLERLKGPATATGAALLAVAGGVAARRSRSGRSGLISGLGGKKVGKKVVKSIKKVDLPKADDAIDWIEEKAKVLGDTGYKVAEASSQARSAKKAVSKK